MSIDELKNPEYRKGRCGRTQVRRRKVIAAAPPNDDERRARFAAEAARAAFGRFYWSDTLERRLRRELLRSEQRPAQAAVKRRRNRKGE